MDNEKYRSPDWQENKLKELYYAFGTTEEEGLKLFLNLVFELRYCNPSFLENIYHLIDEIKSESIYEISETTLVWVSFWRAFDDGNMKNNRLRLEKLKDLKKTNYFSQQNLGLLYFHIGFIEGELKNHQSAAINFEESTLLLPNLTWSYSNIGVAYSNLGRNEEAVAACQKAIELDPKDATAYYNLGKVHSDLGRKDEAIASYQKAIELDPKFAYPYNGLGYVYSDLGRQDEAIASYQKAIDLDPKYAAPHNNLGYLFLNEGKLEEAKIHLEKSISIDADDYCALINLGITCFQLRERKEAQAHFGLALEKCPMSSVHGSLNKVTALLGLERKEEALELLQQTRGQFKIQQREKEMLFKDWNLLAASPEPPAGIQEFIEQAKIILSYEEK